MTFISRFFHFRIIREFLNSRASISVVGHFRGIMIGTLRLSCERQIDVMYKIVVHVVRQLILELYSVTKKQSLGLYKHILTVHWTASESIIRYSITLN